MRRKPTATELFDYGVDLANRLIYFGSIDNYFEDEPGVNHSSVERFIKGLLLLDLAAPEGDKPIRVFLNSPGGSIYDMWAAYDSIRATKSPVEIFVVGKAMSAAAIILQAACNRILTPHATLMIHQGEDYTGGHPVDVQRWATESKRVRDQMVDILWDRIKEKHSKYKRADVEKLVAYDTYLNAEQAVQLGLADSIFGIADEIK